MTGLYEECNQELDRLFEFLSEAYEEETNDYMDRLRTFWESIGRMRTSVGRNYSSLRGMERRILTERLELLNKAVSDYSSLKVSQTLHDTDDWPTYEEFREGIKRESEGKK